MELEKPKLARLQELQSVNLRPADNGGCVISYSIYTPAKTHSESRYKECTEVFSSGEMEEALDRIKELYRASLKAKLNKEEE